MTALQIDVGEHVEIVPDYASLISAPPRRRGDRDRARDHASPQGRQPANTPLGQRPSPGVQAAVRLEVLRWVRGVDPAGPGVRAGVTGPAPIGTIPRFVRVRGRIVTLIDCRLMLRSGGAGDARTSASIPNDGTGRSYARSMRTVS